MPYAEIATLTGGTPVATRDEIYELLSGALSGHASWSRVTKDAVGSQYVPLVDVWRNDGGADGFPWFLVVGRTVVSANAHVVLGAALEYDSATRVARKALRGASGVGFVNADGYPLVAAAGDEATFPLNGFVMGGTDGTKGLLGGASTGMKVAAAGGWARVLVTARTVWLGWSDPVSGRDGLGWSHGVSTYRNVHSVSVDQRPLTFMAVPETNNSCVTVWQHPSASDTSKSRSNSNYSSTSTSKWLGGAAGLVSGEVGGKPDLLFGGVVGAPLAVQRTCSGSKFDASVSLNTCGGLLGVCPPDVLVFKTAATVTNGDSLTVAGRRYVAVGTSGDPGFLFVNTTPDT